MKQEVVNPVAADGGASRDRWHGDQNGRSVWTGMRDRRDGSSVIGSEVGMERLRTLRKAKTMAEKKTLAWSEQWFEEGRQEGRLDMLVGFVRERFGDAVAEKAHPALAAMPDPKALDRARAWLVGSESADAFLARLKSA